MDDTEDYNELFKQGIEEGKKNRPKTPPQDKSTCVKISINPEADYPLYTVRIPRNLAVECELKKGDKLCFFIEEEEGKKILKARLKR